MDVEYESEATDEYYILAAQFLQQEARHQATKYQIQLSDLRNLIGDWKKLKKARTEFKSLLQVDSENIVEFNRRERKLFESASAVADARLGCKSDLHRRIGGPRREWRGIPPTRSNGHATKEYFFLPAQFLQQEAGHPASTLQIQLNKMRNRMGE